MAAFADAIPFQERPRLAKAHATALALLPQLEIRKVYGIPFYYLQARVGYWNRNKKDGLYFGFTKGKLLQPLPGYLQQGGRAQVALLPFPNAAPERLEVFRALLTEARELDAAGMKER